MNSRIKVRFWPLVGWPLRNRGKRMPVFCAWALLCNRRQMRCCAIALVLLKAVSGMVLMERDQQTIPMHLGQN